MADQYDQIRRAIASGNPLTVYMHREAMMTPLEGDVRELVRELDALREDARRMRMALTRLLDSHRGGYPLGAALNFADEVLQPSKDADSGEVGKAGIHEKPQDCTRHDA